MLIESFCDIIKGTPQEEDMKMPTPEYEFVENCLVTVENKKNFSASANKLSAMIPRLVFTFKDGILNIDEYPRPFPDETQFLLKVKDKSSTYYDKKLHEFFIKRQSEINEKINSQTQDNPPSIDACISIIKKMKYETQR